MLHSWVRVGILIYRNVACTNIYAYAISGLGNHNLMCCAGVGLCCFVCVIVMVRVFVSRCGFDPRCAVCAASCNYQLWIGDVRLLACHHVVG